MNVRDQIEGFEGRRNEAYPDPLTHGEPWTIGVGHTGPEVHEGLVWTDEQIDAAFDADLNEKLIECELHFTWFNQLNWPRQAVLIGMCFQMGIGRLLGFKNTLAMVGSGDYAGAAAGMRSSNWAHQTPKRALRLAAQMQYGVWG
jgi:lysozyme